MGGVCIFRFSFGGLVCEYGRSFGFLLEGVVVFITKGGFGFVVEMCFVWDRFGVLWVYGRGVFRIFWRRYIL